MILPKNTHYATFKNFRDLIMPIDKFSNFLFVADVPIFDNVIVPLLDLTDNKYTLKIEKRGTKK